MNKAGCPTGQIYDTNKQSCTLPKQNLRPMTCWPGGKSRVSKEIINKIPEHNIFVEPFIGGGSIYFQKTLVNLNVINDKNKYLIKYYKEMAKLSPNQLNGCKHPNHKQWKKLKKKFDEKKPMTVCEFWMILNGSYSCKIEAWGHHRRRDGSPIGVNTIKNLSHYQNKLNKTKILNQDYKIVVKNFDDKNAFFYVDPPYYKAVKYNMPPVDPFEVASTFKNVKGNVMISYNNHPVVKKAFPKSDGWKYHYLDIPYTMQDNYKDSYYKTTRELLITNF